MIKDFLNIFQYIWCLAFLSIKKQKYICGTKDTFSWNDVINKSIDISDKWMIAKVLCKRQEFAPYMKKQSYALGLIAGNLLSIL